jgi:hypothetical protein
MGKGIQRIYFVAFTNLVAGCCLVLAEWQAAGVQIFFATSCTSCLVLAEWHACGV